MRQLLRQKLIEALSEHFKYDTMSSWNNSKQYARNVKIHKIGIPREISNIAYDLTQHEWFYDNLRNDIEDFEYRQNNNFTIGFNGRSSGYCVLYGMRIEKEKYKTRCDKCWKPTWYETEIKCPNCTDGVLRILKNPMTKKVTSNKSFINPEELDDYGLIETFKVVMDFDKTVDGMIESTKYYARAVLNKEIDIETGCEPENNDITITTKKEN